MMEHDANYDHYWSSIGIWRNIPVVIGGGGGGSDGDKHIEHYINGSWVARQDFPFVNNHIFGYSMATLDDYLYIFGKVMFMIFSRKSQNILKVEDGTPNTLPVLLPNMMEKFGLRLDPYWNRDMDIGQLLKKILFTI